MTATTQAVLDDIEAHKKSNARGALWNFGLGAVAFAAATVAGVMLPFEGLLMLPPLALGATGALFVHRLAQNRGREKTLDAAKKDIAAGTSLTTKIAGLSKNFYRFRNVMDAMTFTSTALLVVSVFNPLVPAALALTGFGVAYGAMTVKDFFRSQWNETARLANVAEGGQGAKAKTKAQKPAPAPKALKPVTPEFTKTVEAPKAEVAAPAPVVKAPTVPALSS